MKRVLQPRLLVVLGLNVWMGTAAGAEGTWSIRNSSNENEALIRCGSSERESFIDNLLVRMPFIIEMIWWTGLTPWMFKFPFPDSLTSSFLSSTCVFLRRSHRCGFLSISSCMQRGWEAWGVCGYLGFEGT